MPKRVIEGATFHFKAVDEPTVAEVCRILRTTREHLREHWKLPATRHLRVRLVTRWYGLLAACRWIDWVLFVVFLPVKWYKAVLAGMWPLFYAVFVSTSKGRLLFVKPMRLLPRGAPPQIVASFDRGSAELDHLTTWRLEVCQQILAAWYEDRYPQWLTIAMFAGLANEFVDTSNDEPIDPRPILKWAGWHSQEVDPRHIASMSQDELDEAYCRSSWQGLIAGHLLEYHEEVLCELLSSRCSPDEFDERLARGLGLPPDRLFAVLARRVLDHLPDSVPNLQPAEPSVAPSGDPASRWLRAPRAFLVAMLQAVAGLFLGILLLLTLGNVFELWKRIWQWNAPAGFAALLVAFWMAQLVWIGWRILVDVMEGKR